MSTQEPPKIEFPCENYPIKVVCIASDAVKSLVLSVTEHYAPGFDRSRIKVTTSREGRFQSITLHITATGADQLKDYHQALIAHDEIKMVL